MPICGLALCLVNLRSTSILPSFTFYKPTLNSRGTYPTQNISIFLQVAEKLNLQDAVQSPQRTLEPRGCSMGTKYGLLSMTLFMVDCSKLHLLAVESRLPSASSNVNNIHTLHSDSSFGNSSYSTRSRIMTRCLQFSTMNKGSPPEHSTQSLRPTDSPLHGSVDTFRYELRSVGAQEPQPISSP